MSGSGPRAASDAPRTRRQTRAAILTRLLGSEGLHRPQLAAACRLTEGSISRILAELRAEGLVEEPRRPTPYPGGPSSIVVLHKDARVAALEFANDRLGFGVAALDGTADTATRLPLPAASPPEAIAAATAEAIGSLETWCRRQGVTPRQIAVSLPGYRGAGRNPILRLDAAALEQALRRAFPGVPLALCNTVTAQAAIHLHGQGATAGRQLFVYLGHGVGAAWVEPLADPARPDPPIRPVELGHVVIDPAGPLCRCGHRGCLEAHVSTVALAGLAGVAEAELLAAGPRWPQLMRPTPRRRTGLEQLLRATGIALGNALNAAGPARIVVCGWPATLPEPQRAALEAGVESSLFGGLTEKVVFLPPVAGQEPAATLAYAAHALAHAGGLGPIEDVPARLAG